LAFDLGQETQKEVGIAEQRWEKLPSGWVKCNTDGAFYEQQWQGATGVVLRNVTGAFIRGGTQWYNHCLDALKHGGISLPGRPSIGASGWDSEGLA